MTLELTADKLDKIDRRSSRCKKRRFNAPTTDINQGLIKAANRGTVIPENWTPPTASTASAIANLLRTE